MKITFLVLLSLFSPLCTQSKKNAQVAENASIAHITLNGPDAFNPENWRGVNLPLPANANQKKQLSQEDFDYAANAGANVIRLVVLANPNGKFHATSFFDNNNNFVPVDKNQGIASLKNAINMAAKDNLKIIIDMHSMPGYTDGKIWTDPQYWQILSDLWVNITNIFKNNKTVVAFDLMNEPNVIKYIKDQNMLSKSTDEVRMNTGKWSVPDDWKNTPRDYTLEISKLIKNIRNADPGRYVIVEGYGLKGNPVNYNWMKPITGFDKVIYSFHMYVPTDLTMLGTKGSEQNGGAERAGPFTLNDQSKIDKAFAPVLAFQKKYNVPIFVGEFGVTTEGVFGKDKDGNPYNGACWLKCVIEKMNVNKWGWTYWDFWTPIRKPQSNDDPRYQILSAAMKGKPIGDYCK